MWDAVMKLLQRDRVRTHRIRRGFRRNTLRPKHLLLEPLENRIALSVSLSGIPNWLEQGPRPLINSGGDGVTSGFPVVNSPLNPAAGAVESIAVNPANPQQIFIGTVNGGVWRTNNANPAASAATSWSSLTDQLGSLSIGSIEFSPLDATGNTLYAGTGSFSSLGSQGGPAIGVIRTTDGGATWRTFAINPGGEARVKAILPTSIDTDAGAGVQQLVLAATVGGGGLYRSNDNGETYTLLSGANGLPGGDVTSVIADPNNTQRFFAGVPNNGVYRGDFNAGTGVITWTAVNTGITNIGTAGNIQLAAHDDGANTVLFALLSGPNQGAFRSTDGSNWTPLAQPPALFQRDVTTRAGNTIVADPNANDVVYISTYESVAHTFRYDPSGAGSWVSIAYAGADNGTGPHADGRDLAIQVVSGTTYLLEADDGGIYLLPNPTDAANNEWLSYNGEGAGGNGLGDAEMHNVAWDSISNILIAGLQDNGTVNQQSVNGQIWNQTLGADGGDVQVDNLTLAGGNQSIRYFSDQNLGNFRRQVVDSANSPVGGPVEILPGGGLTNFTAPFITPFELNAIAPPAGQSTRLVVGGSGTSPVYESTDAGTAANPTWTAANVPTSGTTIGTVTAMAYGGRRLGVDNPNLLYVGDDNGNVFVRTDTTGGSLTATTTAFPGADVQDISLDPNDWQHAFVISSSGVWETLNMGGDWIPRTGSLVNNLLKTVEFIDNGAVDALLVGGLGGVFRMITNSPNVWSEYGQFLPNAITFDLDFVADDPDNNAADGTGVLVAGTFGRGAWKVEDASSTLTVTGVLQIFGDEDFAGQDDTIALIVDPNNSSLLNVSLNGDFSQYQLSTLQQINVFGFGGKDTLIVDSTNGLINVPLGIRYDGGSGSDALQLLQTAGPTLVSDTYSVGPDNGAGVSTIVGAGTAGTQIVSFENLSPVLDLVPSPLLTVNATGGDNAINYTAGSLVTQGLVSIDAQEPIEFANKVALVINALAGADTIGINNSLTPLGLGSISVNGGDPGGGDVLTINGAGVAASVSTATASITGATGAAGAVAISYSGIETLALTGGITDLSFTATAANDTLSVTPGTSGAANSGSLVSNGAVPDISFTNNGNVTANLAGGNDVVNVTASAVDNIIAVSGVAVAITGRNTVNYSNVESVAVYALAGSDTINVTPSAVAVFIDGGDPIGALPGDLLNIAAGGQSVTYNAGAHTDEGSFLVGANAPVSFDNIESFGITGSGPAVINGTNGPDAITVIARDSSTHAATDGVRDFTVAVNTGPQLLFIDVASLTVNALGGSDEITLVAPAPNNAVWDVDVAVNGGPPAVDGDKLIVQTPGAGSETVAYTPNAADGGTLDLSSLSSLVTLTEIETLNYDGQNDNDSLTVIGTGVADTIVHNPGATDQAGNLQVNGLLAISYQNVGAAAALAANGDAGTDTLVVNGTAVNDTFSVGATGNVSLNTRLAIGTVSVETLTLEGLAGDDSITLVPSISASVYSTMNFNGGAQASATGDRMFLVGTAGDDVITISGQTVVLGSRTVNGSGIENIRLDALVGTDQLTYNGVAGITENITVSSSGVAGGGQISVPGVTLIDFSGGEFIDVNGNAPSPTETDTLTFAGTNAADLFNINLSATGTTNADPILILKNADTLATLLTLRGYTNFNTLRNNGLDGNDIFNVYTSNTGPTPGRNLFVDGGQPTGKKKSTDLLNVFYVSPRPRIIQSAETQDPDAGLVDLNYTTRRYVVQYDDIENVTIRKS